MIKVRPCAPKTEIKGVLKDGSLKIDISAPQEKGKANRELVRFLSQRFNVPLKNIDIVKGKKSRNKVVMLDVQE